MSRLNLAKPYRGFESTSLRHTVWVAEKFGCLVPKIVQNRRNSSTSALKQDRRKCPAFLLSQAFMRFSLEGRHAVRFQRLHQANAMRSQTDDKAKGLDF